MVERIGNFTPAVPGEENDMSKKNVFELKRIYRASNGRRFKCVAVDVAKVTFAPVRGCVVFAKKAFIRKLQVNRATKRECIKINENSRELVWLTA